MLDEINFLKYILKNSESADVQGEEGGHIRTSPYELKSIFT